MARTEGVPRVQVGFGERVAGAQTGVMAMYLLLQNTLLQENLAMPLTLASRRRTQQKSKSWCDFARNEVCNVDNTLAPEG